MTKAWFIIDTNEYGEEIGRMYAGHDRHQAFKDLHQWRLAFSNTNPDFSQCELRDIEGIEDDDAFSRAGTTRERAIAECYDSLVNKIERREIGRR